MCVSVCVMLVLGRRHALEEIHPGPWVPLEVPVLHARRMQQPAYGVCIRSMHATQGTEAPQGLAGTQAPFAKDQRTGIELENSPAYTANVPSNTATLTKPEHTMGKSQIAFDADMRHLELRLRKLNTPECQHHYVHGKQTLHLTGELHSLMSAQHQCCRRTRMLATCMPETKTLRLATQ